MKIISHLCSILITSNNEHSMFRKGVYLEALSHALLTNPLDELSNFVCSAFTQTEVSGVIDKQISCQQHMLGLCVSI